MSDSLIEVLRRIARDLEMQNRILLAASETKMTPFEYAALKNATEANGNGK